MKIVKCDYCGKEIKIPPSREKLKHHFCCKEHHNLFMEEKYLMKCDICSQAGEYDRSCSDCNDCEVKQVINRCLAKQNTIMQNFVISILEIFDIEVVKND